MRFEFDWDPAKAESNRRKHDVAFEDAMGVFNDALDYLSKRASAQGISLSSLVNKLLKKDIELIDAAK